MYILDKISRIPHALQFQYWKRMEKITHKIAHFNTMRFDLSLHSSPYYTDKHDGRVLPECDRYADCLVRLPMFYDLTDEQVINICDTIKQFFSKNNIV